MNKQLHARKRRQFKSLCKQLNRLLQGNHTHISKQKIEAIILKIKHLLSELSGIIARWEIKKMLGAAAVIFGLTSGSVQGQSFAEPVENAFGISANLLLSTPNLVDLDGDGDLDLLLGDEYSGGYYGYGEVVYYENIGTPSEPSFAQGQLSAFGLRIKGISSINPLLGVADLDNDGDLDVLANAYDYSGAYDYMTYLENVGTSSAPEFIETNTPPGIDGFTESYYIVPTFGDLDGDGDFDLVVGIVDDYDPSPYNLYYLENIGTASIPEFAAPQGNPFGLTFPPSTEVLLPVPALADLDNDGDLDLLSAFIGYYTANDSTEYGGGIFYFENEGTPTNPEFVVSEINPLDIKFPEGLFYQARTPGFGDLDNDGDIDMLFTSFGSGLLYFENVLITNTSEPHADFPVNISPNPTNNYLNITTDEPLTQIEIYDISGKQVAAYDGRQTQISIQDLSSGIYMIRLINQEGKYLSKRIEKL